MNRLAVVCSYIVLIGILSGLCVTAQNSGGLGHIWRDVWQSYSEHYSYFDHKGVDWDQVWIDHSSDFDDISNGEMFAQRLHEALLVLSDRHVYVRFPSGELKGFQPEVEFNFHPSRLIYPKYASADGYENLNDAGAIVHAWIGTDIAHILVLTLGSRFTDNISDDDIENLFNKYAGAKAMIIDIRANNGGNELNGRRLAGRWTEEARVYGYTQSRIPGNDQSLFTAFKEKTLRPVSNEHFRGPVIGLIGEATISSGESFALMIRALPNGVLIGDTTRGASGNPILQEIPELDVAYSISTWIAYDAEGEIIEDRGVIPDVVISPDSSFDEEQDFVLDAAMEWIRRFPEDRVDVPLSWIARHDLDFEQDSDSDSDGMSDLNEFFSATDPNDGSSNLAIHRIEFEGDLLVLCWKAVEGKSYRLEWSDSPDFGAINGAQELGLAVASGELCVPVPHNSGRTGRFFRLSLIVD